ncbi:MAG: uracil-DNA glycosylase [Rhodothermales bacterium]
MCETLPNNDMNTPETLQSLNRAIANFLFEEPSTDELFNPYSTQNPAYDRAHAAHIRQENLRRYVEERDRVPSLFVLAEAPGPWGCRFTGVPITSEEQLLDPGFPHDGDQTSDRDTPLKEYSASIYWRVLSPYARDVFTWNTVPFHPFKPGKPMTIRTPRVSEIKRFTPLLEDMLAIVQPARIAAIGRKAEKALGLIGHEATYVRHPSQGGALLFEEGIRTIIDEMGLQPAS